MEKTKETIAEHAIKLGVLANELEVSLIKLRMELITSPVAVIKITETIMSLQQLRKTIADLAYDKDKHCESCYEQADTITNKIENCELCVECLYSTNDNTHIYQCWKVHQAY